jgi:hypothetical protein
MIKFFGLSFIRGNNTRKALQVCVNQTILV